MSAKARETVSMRDFPGLMTDTDPRDLEQGAARLQVNVACFSGRLEVRQGMARLSFEDDGEVSSP